MTVRNPVKETWQAYASDVTIPRLEDVRAGAAKFDRQIRMRNSIEYGAGAIVIAAFSYYAISHPGFWAKVANVLIVIGTCFVMWQLHRRASILQASADLPLSALLQHQRQNLVRQRDALKSVFWWYLLPFIPGQMVFLIAIPKPPGTEWMTLVFAGFLLLGLLAIWSWNQKGAAKLQKAIDEVDSIGRDLE
jgi:hypothetical protein